MASHTAPPPLRHHLSPDQVFTIRSSVRLSRPLDGSPGTVQKRHRRLPVCASRATTEPRTPESDPLYPMYTFPPPTRGAPVIPVTVVSTQTGVSQSCFP